ncbi:tetratricopeptide repeat protein [Flavobacteriaceae bacterium]|nr:tetratricopeptide repeat protein [Flavobacteriaceae bacterium]
MKKIIVIIIMFTTVFGFSQKKELRNAEKRLNEGFYNEALDILSQIEGVIISSEQKFQAHYYYLLGWANKGDTNYDDAVPLLRKAIDLDNFDKYTEDAGILIDQIEIELVNLAVQDNKNEDFISASKRLYDAYLINPDKDENVNYLYFAASSSVNGNDYQVALEYYNKLKKMNYTGIVSEYFITPVDTQTEEKVSETEYNLFKSSKDYTNPRVGKTESRLPEIVKNIALIYVQLGETDMAITAIEDARKIRPDDLNLLLSEADLYMKLGNKEKFKTLMQEAITKDPDNAILYYNLGVINVEQGEFEDAMNYYKKSLELDPNYASTYLNLVGLILEGEEALVEQMNELATSNKRSDFEKYDKLKQDREDLYASCLPYLEKLIEIDPTNIEALKTAKNIYYTVGDNENYKQMSAKIDEIENQ